MWRSRLLASVLAVMVAVALPGAAQSLASGLQEESAEPDAAVDEAAPDPESEQEAEAEPEAEGQPDAETESDADKPGLLVIETDAASHVYVDGQPEGLVEPGEPLEVRVDLGEVSVRAVADKFGSVIWEKTLELEDPGAKPVRIRMAKEIRKFQREERKVGVFRDPKHELMWPKRDNGSDVDLRLAYAYCRDLLTGGFDDWRLPLLEELESLQAIWERGSYKILGGILLTECCVWSSEYDGTERAWTFNYRFRQAFQTNAGYKIGLRALCVREWDPEAEEAAKAAAEEAESEETEPEGDRGERRDGRPP